ncbi:hypothetical protein KEM55_001799 [Ascosphaera atra]|nr:hypothetical protein KEM55_001799 [Ascosphaera atra]
MAASSTHRSNRVHSHEKNSQTDSVIPSEEASAEVGVGEGDAPEGHAGEGNIIEENDGNVPADMEAMEDQGHREHGVATPAPVPTIRLGLETVKALRDPIMEAVERRLAEYSGYHQGPSVDIQEGYEEAAVDDEEETEDSDKGGKDRNEKARTAASAAAQQLLRYFSGPLSGSLSSVEDLIHVLENAFGDPGRKATAQTKLQSLFQRSKDFATYYTEFQCLSADCCFDEKALRSFLHRSLSSELQFALALVPETEIDIYSKLVYRCQHLDNSIRAATANINHFSSRPRYINMFAQLAFKFRSPVQNRPVSTVTTNIPALNNQEGDPIDLSSAPRGPISDTEHCRYTDNRLCL